jgi:hypothetical protein
VPGTEISWHRDFLAPRFNLTIDADLKKIIADADIKLLTRVEQLDLGGKFLKLIKDKK